MSQYLFTSSVKSVHRHDVPMNEVFASTKKTAVNSIFELDSWHCLSGYPGPLRNCRGYLSHQGTGLPVTYPPGSTISGKGGSLCNEFSKVMSPQLAPIEPGPVCNLKLEKFPLISYSNLDMPAILSSSSAQTLKKQNTYNFIDIS